MSDQRGAYILRLPTEAQPHSMEVRVYDPAASANFLVRAQEAKSGAGRGSSPRWYGFKPVDFEIMRELAYAPAMRQALVRAEKALWEQCSHVVDGVRQVYDDERGEPWREIAALLLMIQEG